MRISGGGLAIACLGLLAGGAATPAMAIPFSFSTGNTDGLIATASRPDTGSGERETGDDFILRQTSSIDQVTFTGLIPSGATIDDVVLEIYRVFPKDSLDPPSGNVPTRMNSPSDVAFETRDLSASDFTFTSSILNPTFTAQNSVINGIFPQPGQFTGGEGSVTGEEVLISADLSNPFDLPADHYFFVPQVALSDGNFLWLSAPKPIKDGTGPFLPDLQTWIRNDPGIAPDWLRIGTDITHQGPFNATFSLAGERVSEPSSLVDALTGLGLLGLFAGFIRHRRKEQA